MAYSRGAALLLLLLVVVGAACAQEYASPWTYLCEGQGTGTARCVKEEAVGGQNVTLNACKLTCGQHSLLWPYPATTETLGTDLSSFTVTSMSELVSAPAEVFDLLNQNLILFRKNLDMYHPDYDFDTGMAPWTVPTDPDIESHVLRVEISVISAEDRLSLTTDESYSLNIVPALGQTTAVIAANTFFGARHGLESLSQLINYDEHNDCLQGVNSAEITNDAPAFPFRGVILDTARNYFTIRDIERTIDALAANKLNTFHWHITDTHSFPVIMESLPKMHRYGAYSGRQLYTAEQVRQIVEYGRVRGVRVMPEFEGPAHVGNGWQWGPQDGLGDLAVCVNQEPWSSYCITPPCGQLNIANENMYTVLEKVYQELVSMFEPLDLFHYGGEDANLNCWNTTTEITDWMATVGDGTLSEDAYYLQWGHFQNRSYDLFTAANGGNEIKGIIWSSSITKLGEADKYLDKNKYIIQIWNELNDPIITEFLEKGFQVIFTNHNALYLDCGFGAWFGEGNNWCSPYKEWQQIYDNSPHAVVGNPDYFDQIIGGEVGMWTEQVDAQALDSRVWPRASALAERMWTNPSHSWRDAEYRLIHHRQRLVGRGIAADRIQPEWCHQNEGLCYL